MGRARRLLRGRSSGALDASGQRALLSAAGALEFVATVLALERQIIPPTINLHVPDPECDLDYVASGARSGVTLAAVMGNPSGWISPGSAPPRTYSVVLPSKCSLSASASPRVWWTTPSRWLGGAYSV